LTSDLFFDIMETEEEKEGSLKKEKMPRPIPADNIF
jgi:hypothetical protein